MHIVGLTGGIGSGKSTVACYFSGYGVPIIDADQIAHQLSIPPSPALNLVRDAFGADYLEENGCLARARLRERIFTDPEAKAVLEAIFHPLILHEMDRQQKQLPPHLNYAVWIVPLLFEAPEFKKRVDRIVWVDCTKKTQMQRILSRPSMTSSTAYAILASQEQSLQYKVFADDILENNGSLEALAASVRQLHEKYKSWSRINIR